MKPFVKRILLFVGFATVICGSFLVIKAFVYKESSDNSDFYDKVKKEMNKNPNKDHLSLFQAMQAVTAQENLEKKSKITDLNDPRNDPRLKYYFGATEEIAPVPAVINYGGLTMKVQANELIMSNLDISPISGRQSERLRFLFMYPQMIGKTKENFNDFYRGIPGEQKNIWLDINTEPACFTENDVNPVQVISEDFSKLDKRQQELLMLSKDCQSRRRFEIAYSIFGNKNHHVQGTYRYQKIYGWKDVSVYPDLSKYYTMDNLTIVGYGIKGLTENNTDIIDERVYKYIPPHAKADEYEFIVCGSNPDVIPKKFPKLRFDNDLHASCTHYILIKNRMIAQINYSEKYFKENWQVIRDAVVKHFDSRITKIDDYVPQFYTKHNNTYQAVSHKQIDDLIQQNPIQTKN